MSTTTPDGNTIATQAIPARSGFKLLAWPAAIALVLALLFVGITGFFRLGRDARCLRNSLLAGLASHAVTSEKKLELSAGPISFSALRAGLSLVPLRAEVQTGLQAVHGAEVGIYHLNPGTSELDTAALLSAADRAMTPRGWDRLVKVARNGDLVAVYVWAARNSGTKLRACVAVLHERQLIVASGRTDLAPLMELVANRPEWKERSWDKIRL